MLRILTTSQPGTALLENLLATIRRRRYRPRRRATIHTGTRRLRSTIRPARCRKPRFRTRNTTELTRLERHRRRIFSARHVITKQPTGFRLSVAPFQRSPPRPRAPHSYVPDNVYENLNLDSTWSVGEVWTLKSGATFIYLSFKATFSEIHDKVQLSAGFPPPTGPATWGGVYYNAVIRPACYAKTT